LIVAIGVVPFVVVIILPYTIGQTLSNLNLGDSGHFVKCEIYHIGPTGHKFGEQFYILLRIISLGIIRGNVVRSREKTSGGFLS